MTAELAKFVYLVVRQKFPSAEVHVLREAAHEGLMAARDRWVPGSASAATFACNRAIGAVKDLARKHFGRNKARPQHLTNSDDVFGGMALLAGPVPENQDLREELEYLARELLPPSGELVLRERMRGATLLDAGAAAGVSESRASQLMKQLRGLYEERLAQTC